MIWKKIIIKSVILIILVLTLQTGLFFNANFIEYYYSGLIYKFISSINRTLTSFIPFAFGDVIYLIVIYQLIRILIKKDQKILRIVSGILNLITAFYICWGFNYFRKPLHQSLNINSLEYSDEELINYTDNLIKNINTVHYSITENDTLAVDNPLDFNAMKSISLEGYHNISKKHSTFNYQYLSVKKSIFSLPLTYFGFGGYLNPFTNEANVNSYLPKIKIPMTICHEMGHQLGYASESDTNFIGYLAAVNNSNLYFQYSGYYTALRYALADIYKRDESTYHELKANINPGIIKNMIENQQFWEQYQNPIEPIIKNGFNFFLKFNNQEDGIKSYSKLIALIINYEKSVVSSQ